ncbi:hypothetical protein HC823_02475 [Candidatus Gracilibacteria bacterium]|nr:hypothetical protein [Candidatus Gracilibacteria bacterium]
MGNVQAQFQTYRMTTQEINDVDRLGTAVYGARYFNTDTGIYMIGNADGTIGAIPGSICLYYGYIRGFDGGGSLELLGYIAFSVF